MSIDEAIARLLDQLAPLPVSVRAMFGQRALFCDEELVGMVTDEGLFIKATPISLEFLSEENRRPPFPRAKNYFHVPSGRLADAAWLQVLVARTAEEEVRQEACITRRRAETAACWLRPAPLARSEIQPWEQTRKR